MQEPRISLRRLLQPRGRLDSLKASEKLWLLCVEYKALLAKVHSVREEKKKRRRVLHGYKIRSFTKSTNIISQKNTCIIINRRPMSVCPAVSIKSN